MMMIQRAMMMIVVMIEMSVANDVMMFKHKFVIITINNTILS